LIQTKTNLSRLKKFGIKYGFEGFDERNNFSIHTSSDWKWILDEKTEKLLGLNLKRIW
jgi:hypothetical protein